MGLVSGIGKVFTSYIPKTVNYGYRAVKVSPDIIFGKGADTFVKAAGKVTKGAGESWLTAMGRAVKEGGKAVESSVAATKAVKGGFFKQAFGSLRNTPKVIRQSIKDGAAASKGLGKIWGGTKGLFKGIGKKMPLIGNLMLIAFELPNIIKATKEQGIGQGIAEVAKAGSRLGGAALGAAIGSAFGPIGSLVGWVAGEWLTGKIVGKSYSEKVAEAEQKQAEAIAMQQEIMNQMGVQPTAQPPFTGNTQMPNLMSNFNDYSNPYANDIMYQQFNTVA